MRKTLSLLMLLAAISFIARPAKSADPEVVLPAKERLHLYLLIGQSNMAGRGVIEEQDKKAHPRVVTFTKQSAWAPAVDPLHSDKPIAGVGLGSSFGRAMAEANPDVTIGLIPSAVGGTPLSRWQKDGDLYKQAVVRAKAAMKDGSLRGILWHQGESDSGSETTARNYGERLAQMVRDLRAELGTGDVPFVAGQLGDFLRRESKEGKPSFWPIVNEQLASLGELVKKTAVVSAKDLKHKGDEVHFDSASLRKLGKRYATAMLALQEERVEKADSSKSSSMAKPNILLIVADDLGWRDVGWHGGTFQTPTLDKLVREGVELDRHYVQPVCSPTRTALLSGRWTSRFGKHVLSPTNLRAFPLGTTTLASALKECGYTTHVAGKWHLGSKPEWGPNHYGFDHSYGSLNGAVDPWTHKYRKGPYEDTWHRDLKRVDEEGNATELVGREVVEWIRAKRTPWLVYVPFHAVHVPVDAPDEYKRRYEGVKFHDDPEKDDSLRRMAAMVTQLDAKVGEFIAALDETGQRENTLVVFTSDNGGKLKSDNPYVGNVAASPALSSNLPLRGEKAQLYEGGVRVCAFANWPGRLAPSKLTAPLHAADWMPTLTKLAGWQNAARVEFDGIDAWPLLTGKNKNPEPRTIYIPTNNGAAVLHDGWKLIARNANAAPKNELFHVSDDPSETRDLAAEQPDRVEKLQAILSELRKDDLAVVPVDLQGVAP